MLGDTLFSSLFHCSCSNLYIYIYIYFFFSGSLHLEVPFLLYTSKLIASWPFIYNPPNSPLDACPLKLQLKVVEGAV